MNISNFPDAQARGTRIADARSTSMQYEPLTPRVGPGRDLLGEIAPTDPEAWSQEFQTRDLDPQGNRYGERSAKKGGKRRQRSFPCI